MRLWHVRVLTLLGTFLWTMAAWANEAPVAAAGPDQTVSAGAEGTASVSLDGSASTDPDGDVLTFTWTGPFTEGNGTLDGAKVTVTLPLGEFTLTLTVKDPSGASASDTVLVTVKDTTPPEFTVLFADPSVLWPPNHKMIPITVQATVTDNCDKNPTVTIVTVTSNEPVNGKGDGNTAPDWLVTADLTLELRAERAGPGTGRIYTITVSATDASGNTATKDVQVLVPHDQGDADNGDDDSEDGGLTSQEWQQIPQAIKAKQGELYTKLLSTYDKNGDGRISGSEKRALRKAMRDHLRAQKGKNKARTTTGI